MYFSVLRSAILISNCTCFTCVKLFCRLRGLNDGKLVLQECAGKLAVVFYSKCTFCWDFQPFALLTVLYPAC